MTINRIDLPRGFTPEAAVTVSDIDGSEPHTTMFPDVESARRYLRQCMAVGASCSMDRLVTVSTGDAIDGNVPASRLGIAPGGWPLCKLAKGGE